jgi:flagellar biosynthesis repressor protein FlbT
LYFMIQMMLMDPALHMKARTMARESVSNLLTSLGDRALIQGLRETGEMLESDRPFDALRKVRALLPMEMANSDANEPTKEVA